VWQLKTTFDYSNLGAFNHLMMLTKNRIYLVQNNPNQSEVSFIYLDLDPTTTLVKKAYQDTLLSANSGQVFFGSPTKVNYVGPGLDDNNQLILMTLTLPRGAQDLKQTMTLG
jgi:hypothetical protein